MFNYYFKQIKVIGNPLETVAVIYRGEDLVDEYYSQKELQIAFSKIKQKTNQNLKITKNSLFKFEQLFKSLKPYLKNTKKIKTIKEYKEVLEKYADFWAHIALLFVLPSLNIPKQIKQKALTLRKQAQEFNESLEPLFKKFIETKYPYLKGNYRFILPQEIFNGEVNNKQLIKKIIQQRKKEFVYYQGKLYTRDINKTLDKLNLALERNKN
jgi:hypothetical protein